MKKILVPCDFSETSENALKYAIDTANDFAAELVLLHVNQIPVVNSEFGLSAYSITETNDASLKQLKELSEKIKLTATKIPEIEYYTEMGNVTDVIIEYSKNFNIDLTIMGISGHGKKLVKTLFGSTAVSVSKHIESSLIIVPPNVKYKRPVNIAFACDYDKAIEHNTSLNKVKEISGLFNSELHVLHVVPENHDLNADESEVDVYVENKLVSATHRTYILTENNISEALLEYISTHDIDLVIIEPKKHSVFHNVFYPSITNELAFFSPVPLFTIHG